MITGLGVGGAERLVIDLADSLIELGHQVAILYLTGTADLKPKHSSVRIIGMGVRSPYDFFAVYFRCRRFLVKYKPHVVHSHLFHANILARLLRWSVDIPKLISSAHNNNEGSRWRMFAYRLTDRLTDITTNVSEVATQSFIDRNGCRPDRIRTLHNGINTRRFRFDSISRDLIRKELRISPNSKLIVAVGRLNAAKDYPNLLTAISLLRASNPFQVAIVGDGPLRSELKRLAVALKISNKILWLGVRDDIPAVLSAADVFVLSSAWEGFGLVVAEAMACERVVVATDCGGVKEVLGDVGYLIPPKQPSLLASAIMSALSLSEFEAGLLGTRARKRVEESYSLQQAVRRWIAIYEGQTSVDPA
ncbi:glycosyltransferase [Pigmentiphaga soli]|uniref:glycosyltransferase n=1 Tax=Pigmentiphaga soli TaxID=1007095 RepID=UPI003CD085F0